MQLIDIFTNLLYFTEVNKEFDFNQFGLEDLQKRYSTMITEAEETAHQSGVSDAQWQHALFAIAVWVDEAIMLTGWTHRDQWQRQSLQRTYFHTANGGVEFYTRLQSLGHADAALLELYDVVMSLGFKGTLFRDSDNTSRKEIAEHTMKLLAGSRDMSIAKRLFPNACSTAVQSGPEKSVNWRFIAGVSFVIIPPILFVLIYCVFYIKLSTMTGALLKLF